MNVCKSKLHRRSSNGKLCTEPVNAKYPGPTCDQLLADVICQLKIPVNLIPLYIYIYIYILYWSIRWVRGTRSAKYGLKACPEMTHSAISDRSHVWFQFHVFGSRKDMVHNMMSWSLTYRQGYILTNLINMSVKLFSTVSIVFFPVDFKSARYHSRFCIFN